MTKDIPPAVLDRLQRWLDENAAKIDRSLLVDRGGIAHFVVIQKERRFDPDLMDLLSKLDLEIFPEDSELTTVLFPVMCDDSLRGFIDIKAAQCMTPTESVPYTPPNFQIDRKKRLRAVEQTKRNWGLFYAQNPLYCPYEIGGVDLKSEDINCDVCGSSCRRDLNIESGVLYGHWGFDSARDMDESLTNLCETCFGKVEDFVRSLGGNPKVRNFVRFLGRETRS